MISVWALIFAALFFSSPAQATDASTPGSVLLMSTFQSISVKAPFSGDGNANNAARIQYRATGSSTWLDAYAPFIDRRAAMAGASNPYANQARGSIVGLSPNTSYDVQVTWSDPDGVTSQPGILSISTLTYTPPTGGSTITVTNNATLSSALSTVNPGQTIHMMPGIYAPFTITRSGNSGAWITVEGDASGTTMVSGAGVGENVRVSANFLIVKHLTLSDSDSHGIRISNNVNNVFIQDNTLSNVSAQCASNPKGHYNDGGITLIGNNAKIFVLRNAINSQSLGTPGCTLNPIYDSPAAGIQWYTVTTLVVQDNIVSGGFRDGITSDSPGNQGENVDVVGNTVSGYKDDGVESKGTNINIRFFGNRMAPDGAGGFTCVAGNTNSRTNRYGPLYIFRNTCRVTNTYTLGGSVFKLGGVQTYLFHNSVDASLAAVRWDGIIVANDSANNLVALNNVIRLAGNSIAGFGRGSVLDYNIYQNTNVNAINLVRSWNGTTNYATLSAFRTGAGQELHGKQQNPLFTDTLLHIGSNSPTVDAGVIIANFNDPTSAWPPAGSAPDIGAFEFGEPVRRR